MQLDDKTKHALMDYVYDRVAGTLADLENLFAGGTKLTFLARLPGSDETEILISSDELDEVIKAIERCKDREKTLI